MPPAMILSRPALRHVAIAVAALIALLVLAIAFFPWQWLRGPVAAHLSSSLNREVTLGSLSVDLGRVTRVRLGDVTIANAPWSTQQPMAHADGVVLFFGLPALFRLRPDYVHLEKPDVLLERNAKGDANWQFDDGDDVALDVVNVDAGTLRFLDPTLRADIRATIATQAIEGKASTLRFEGRGTLRGETVALNGQGGGLSSLSHTGEPYPLEVHAKSGGTELDFEGTVVPREPENLRGALRLRGPDLSRLYPIVPSPLPWTPPYNLKGVLAHSSGGHWHFRQFNGVVGDSDLSGTFSVDVSGPRSRTVAELTSAKFNYNDLGGFIGLPPARAATPEQRREAQHLARRDRVLPDTTFELAKLRDHDVDVTFRGKAVRFGAVPIDDLKSHLKLEKGVMRFDPLDFGVGDGHVVSTVTLDANRSPANVEGQVEVRAVELKRLFPKLASPQGTAGRFGGRGHFKAQGNSLAAMAASVDGDAALVMRGGEASTLQLVLTNLDLARAATLLLSGDQTSQIRCAVAAVHVQDGVVRPELFVVDTSAVVIEGEGKLDLANERIDLQLTSKSKQPSLVALRGPIVVDGTFARPTAHPSLAQAGMRVGAAAGLAALAPPLALLPLIDFGGADDVDCRAIMAQAKVETATTERLPRPKPARASAKGRAPSQATRQPSLPATAMETQ